jgi:chaperone modulatory protein CbpM
MSSQTEPAGDAVWVELHLSFTLEGLCRASGAGRDDLLALVDQGLLQPAGQGPEDWRFDGASLRRVRTALRLARDLDLGWAGAALVVELLAELAALRARLPRP